jgi:DNA-binding GntR family transcriptional regulator
VLAGSISPGFYSTTSGWKDEAHGHHAEILAALQVRDGPATAQAVARHLSAGGAYAVQMLELAGFWDAEDADEG